MDQRNTYGVLIGELNDRFATRVYSERVSVPDEAGQYFEGIEDYDRDEIQASVATWSLIEAFDLDIDSARSLWLAIVKKEDDVEKRQLANYVVSSFIVAAEKTQSIDLDKVDKVLLHGFFGVSSFSEAEPLSALTEKVVVGDSGEQPDETMVSKRFTHSLQKLALAAALYRHERLPNQDKASRRFNEQLEDRLWMIENRGTVIKYSEIANAQVRRAVRRIHGLVRVAEQAVKVSTRKPPKPKLTVEDLMHIKDLLPDNLLQVLKAKFDRSGDEVSNSDAAIELGLKPRSISTHMSTIRAIARRAQSRKVE